MSVIFTVPQAQCRIIERFGKFNRVVHEGLHFRIPGMETFKLVDSWQRVASRDRGFIELTEQLTLAEARGSQTRDNVTVEAQASVYWRIVDPVRAVYEVDSLPAAVKDVALNALRANVGRLDLDQVLSERQELNERIAVQLSETAGKWVINFTRVEIREISTTDETARAMRQQMEAERRRRAAVSDAEGQAEAEIKVAEAQRQSAVLRAHGRAEALGLIATAEAAYLAQLVPHVGHEGATQLLLAQKMLEGFEQISRNPGDKVYLPSSFHGLLSLPAKTQTG